MSTRIIKYDEVSNLIETIAFDKDMNAKTKALSKDDKELIKIG